jgi:hypothetical protein
VGRRAPAEADETQSWSLICCIIEVVVETITILIYGIVFYRYYSKRKLRKAMDVRDHARSDLYLAQLRSQSAPNTPGFGPQSPSFSTHLKSPRCSATPAWTHMDDIEEGSGLEKDSARSPVSGSSLPFDSKSARSPFRLQQPPSRSPRSPVMAERVQWPLVRARSGASEIEPPRAYVRPPVGVQATAPVEQGEQVYGEVPIPRAYH